MIKVRWTYSVVTQESAEQGECSEHGFYEPGGWRWPLEDENGYHKEVLEDAQKGEFDVFYDDLRSLISDAEDLGVAFHDDADRACNIDPDIDYRTGESTTYNLHISNERQRHHVAKVLK